MLRPTPSKVRKLRLVLCLCAGVVPRVVILLGVVAPIRFLVVCTTPIVGASARSMSIFHIESAGEASVHVVVFFTMFEYIGAVLRAGVTPPITPGINARMPPPPPLVRAV